MKENDSRVLFNDGKGERPTDAPIVVADGLRTPENVGALVRLLANIGSEKLILVNSEQMNMAKVKRTACMAWDYVKIETCEAGELGEHIPEGYEMVAVETSAQSVSIYKTEMPRRVALVLGSEVHGVSSEILAMCKTHVHIPMTGPDTSMNVSHAACVALFEWVRRFVG